MANQETGDVGRLVLDGTRTVRTADDTRAQLLEMTRRHPALEVDCRGADEVDLSFIQLLLAARLSARLADRTIRLAHPASGALRDALQRGGFLTATTDQAAADKAFWLQAEIA